MRAVAAGIVYFALVLVAGFVLGTIRVLFIAPQLGAVLAVLIELPIMLAVSWMACKFALTYFGIGNAIQVRFTVAIVAFVLLIGAEFALASAIFGRSPASYLADYLTLHGALGLIGQIAFGIIPLIQTSRLSAPSPLD